ncbi:MAG TPA: hypothetical protein DCM59_00995, partial [Clostridium sp.]|nr:hypothetical protein [Clostridium sp.]
MGFYVYKFLNKNKDIIYIGQTNDIMRRIGKQHFTSHGHLSQECYKETTQVFFAQLPSKTDMDIIERYLIGKYRPKYNEVHNNYDVSLSIDEPKWIEYQKDYMAQKALINQLKSQIATERESYQSHIMSLRTRNSELTEQIKTLQAENQSLASFKNYYIEQAEFYAAMLNDIKKIQEKELELYNDLL